MLTNENNWTLPEPIPKPTPKKRGLLFLSPEDMQEAKKSMKEKGIKAKHVKNLPPIEEYMVLICCLLKKYIVLITRHRQ